MFYDLVRIVSAVSAFICFSAASQSRIINKRIDAINEDITKNHPGKPYIHSAYYYSLIFSGILLTIVFVYCLFVDR